MHVKGIMFSVLLAGVLAAGSVAPALGAQMEAQLNPSTDASDFQMIYQRTVFIEYPVGSALSQTYEGAAWRLAGDAGLEDPAVQALQQSLNGKIHSDGSTASLSDLAVEYSVQMTGRELNTSFDLRVVITGQIVNYVITQDQVRTLVDLGWRGMSSDIPVVIDGVDVNIPLNMLQTQEPTIHGIVVGTEAGDILSLPLINADFILEQPMTNWHFLFDPTGINVHASEYGMSKELAGQVLSSWTMGESSIREGIQVEREWEASVTGASHPDLPGDVSFDIRAVQSSDQGNLYIIGFGALDTLEGVEIAGVTAQAPEGFGTTSTGDFPVFIIYGMAGLAAAGGGLFFVFSNRALKKEKQGQQGIDPKDLVGHQTSSASGGYQTNRGEAQLRDASDYQQTRSYYEQTDTATESATESRAADSMAAEQEQETNSQHEANAGTDAGMGTPAMYESACSCIMSAEMHSECDCQMQGSCLCDASCQCATGTCQAHVSSL